MITLTKEEILALEPIKNGLTGVFGGVYCYNDNTLIKMIYDTSNAKKILPIIKNRINSLLDVRVKNVSFPLDVTPPDCKTHFAYLMPEIKGITYEDLLLLIRQGQTDLTLDRVSTIYHNAQNKVFEISSNNIMIWDLKTDNCLLTDSDDTGIIDVDFYKKVNIDCVKILTNNESFLNYTFELFLNDILNVLKIPRRYYIRRAEPKLIVDYSYDFKEIAQDYVDDLLEEIVKKSNAKTLGEILRK